MSINNQQASYSDPDYEPVPAHRHAVHGEQPVTSLPLQELADALNKNSRSVKQSRDKAQYVRQQKGHSFIMEWLVLGIFTIWIRPIYLALSPNHYFHL